MASSALVFVAVGLVMVTGGSAMKSPVQKVIELLEENKVKITNDLAGEEKEMAEYADFCGKESSEKGYAIKTAVAKIADLQAIIEECSMKIPAHEDEVSTLGTEVAAKEKELAEATELRSKEKAEFDAIEKDLVTSIDQLSRAIGILEKATKGASFMQEDGSQKKLNVALQFIGKVIDAGRVSFAGGNQLESLLQQGTFAADDQPQAKEVAYESKSGAIVEKVEEMKEKAEEELTSARNAEMKKSQDFSMLELSLQNGIKVAKDKIGTMKSEIGAKTEEMNKAKGDLTKTEEVKAADEEYLATLKHDCESAAAGWEERQESAKGEMGAINKAIEILSEGVRVFLQLGVKTHTSRRGQLDDAERALDGDDSADASTDTAQVSSASQEQ